MEHVTIPYSGTLLVSHLAAYGLGVALDVAGIDAFVGHDPDSQSFDPVVSFAAGYDDARAAIRASAESVEWIVERDVEPGKTGNDRRSVIWARASMDGDPERLARIVAMRAELAEEADRAPSPIAAMLLGGLGSPIAWGPENVRTAHGATALDGVLGNHTSDFVRGVLRPTRLAAAALDPDPFEGESRRTVPLDKTGWAPPGTPVDYVHQWLAALGLALLPVAHRQLEASTTPACWRRKQGRRGVTLPLLATSVSVSRLRALLQLPALVAFPGERDEPPPVHEAGILRSYGIDEVVVFERRNRSGAGSSVAFDFRRGERVALR